MVINTEWLGDGWVDGWMCGWMDVWVGGWGLHVCAYVMVDIYAIYTKYKSQFSYVIINKPTVISGIWMLSTESCGIRCIKYGNVWDD